MSKTTKTMGEKYVASGKGVRHKDTYYLYMDGGEHEFHVLTKEEKWQEHKDFWVPILANNISAAITGAIFGTLATIVLKFLGF